MSIVTYLIVGFIGFMVGGGVVCLLVASREGDEEHKNSWRDK